jgi:hypothetical protein
MGNTTASIEHQWYWQSNANPWSQDEETTFTPYAADVNEKIERARLEGKKEVIIDAQYRIDLVDKIQVNIYDTFKQRRVMYQPMNIRRDIRPAGVAPNPRFRSDGKAKLSFSTDADFHGCDFIVTWLKERTNGTLELDKSTLVELAIRGIETEALLSPKKKEAMEFAEKAIIELRRVASKSREVIQETCIRLYTQDSFLYQIINETLRDDDRTKLHTLGPFCYILYIYDGGSKRKLTRLPEKIVLYRGERLTPDDIKEYREYMESGAVWRWTQFVSTTKSIAVAQEFSDGNTLYIINMKRPEASKQGLSIACVSEFSQEEEVLLRPGVRFKVMKIEEAHGTNKQLIHIDVLPSHLSSLHQ